MKENFHCFHLFFSAICFLLISSGCRNFATASEHESSQLRQLRQARQQDSRKLQILQQQLAKSRASLHQAVKLYEEETARMNEKLNALQNRCNALTKTINTMQQSNAVNQRKNQVIERDIQILKQQIVAEQTARKKDLKQLMDQVSAQTASAINRIIEAQNRARTTARKPKSSGPVGKGEFIVHTVQKGHTLGAIAAAYHVSIEQIKRANRMKSNVIRIGQKLYIPKKK